MNEICIITRAGPAKILGLKNKGHLGPGADADITVYLPHENKQIMFELPKYVFKSGVLVVEDAEIREPLSGKIFHVDPDYDLKIEKDISEWFEQYYSVRFSNYPIQDDYLHHAEVVECRQKED